ncbi:MAG: ABC transporter substrate-binding protein [Beijerinckiaceae bacterium]|nr:ABC transporter substrate-binding protein [Beijerinckiaceae bacterium]
MSAVWRGQALAVSILAMSSFGGAAIAQAPVEVRVGTLGAISDAPIFIADKKGYFKDEGLDVKMTVFQSAATMVAPLGAGQLDVGAGSPSAGMYNAVARKINVRIVADKAQSTPGYGATKLLVRKDLVDSGRFKTLADLKGMKVAMNAPGVSNTAMLNVMLTSVGLTYSDVETINMSFPDHLLAMRNKAVDAGATIEPIATLAVQGGHAVEIMRDDQIYPNHQIAALIYADDFAKKPDVALRFMKAYIRGIRHYNKALKDGRLAGETADDVIAILNEYTSVKSADLLRKITPTGMDPDGKVNVESLQRDVDFYTSQGLVQAKVDVRSIVDSSFAEAAVKALGPYK